MPGSPAAIGSPGNPGRPFIADTDVPNTGPSGVIVARVQRFASGRNRFFRRGVLYRLQPPTVMGAVTSFSAPRPIVALQAVTRAGTW